MTTREHLTAVFAEGVREVVTLNWDANAVTGRNRLAQGVRKTQSPLGDIYKFVSSHCLSIIGGGLVTLRVNG